MYGGTRSRKIFNGRLTYANINMYQNNFKEITLLQKQEMVISWFMELRDSICKEFEQIEQEQNSSSRFERKSWDRPGGGGGQMSLMHGKVFEKVGVNISTVYGELDAKFATEIPGTTTSSKFWASGISLVAHMNNPLIPAVHLNTRMMVTEKLWFGGGSDLTPTFENNEDTEDFHASLKQACDKFDLAYYPKFKKECDNYFFLKHRNEPRGVGGIFYNYLNTGVWQQDFDFTKEIGLAFLEVFPKIVRRNYNRSWNEAQKESQLVKRGRYVEFNLLYDQGTKFGLMTGGNIEAIFMSLPPYCKWE